MPIYNFQGWKRKTGKANSRLLFTGLSFWLYLKPSHTIHYNNSHSLAFACSITLSLILSLSLLERSMMMEAQEEEVMGYKDHTQIIKGKRTKRQRLPSPLRLAMASSSSSYYSGGVIDCALASPTTSVEFTESTEEEEDMANCLILLAQGHNSRKVSDPIATTTTTSNKPSGSFAYQCKTCNRCFPSFQALGGHRASHKKPKAANTEEKKLLSFVDEEDDRFHNTSTTLSLQTANRVVQCSNINNNKSKVHECSICGTEFSSGQALGGHMRRHRTFMSTTTTATESQEAKKQRNASLQLDLNLPAPEDDNQRDNSKFPFVSKERVLVFSASSLVDCHY